MSFTPSRVPGSDLPIMHVGSGSYGPYPLLRWTLGGRSGTEGAAGMRWSQDRPRPCLLRVCSDVAVWPG